LSLIFDGGPPLPPPDVSHLSSPSSNCHL
jgi:hypothetical protein